MDSFVFCCEHCGKSIKADVADRGAQADCPYCSKPIVIPQVKTMRITSVVPVAETQDVIYVDEPIAAETVEPKKKFGRFKWKYAIIGAIVVVGPMIAYNWIASGQRAAEQAKVDAAKQDKYYSAVRRNNSHPVRVVKRIAPPSHQSANKRYVPSPRVSRNNTSSRSGATTVSRRVSTPPPPAVRENAVVSSPGERYQQFISGADGLIERLNQKSASLTFEQQKAQKLIIAKIENMKSAWQARLKYIKARNEKIAEASKKSYDYALGKAVQQRFEEYTGQKSDWGYNSKCIRFAEQLLKDFENPRLDPNILLNDRRYARYSGNALKAVSSGRIVRKEKLFETLVRRFADPGCLSDRKDFFDYVLINYGLPFENVQYNFDRRFEPDSKRVNEKDSLELLLYDGAIPTVEHLTKAVYASNAEAVTLLLAFGVDPNAVNPDGETALFNSYRIENGSAIRNLLLAAGADPDFRNYAGKKAQDMAVVGVFMNAWTRGALPEIEQGLQQGVDPDMLLANGEPLLLDACKRNDLNLVKVLFKYNVDPNKRGKSRYMPIATTFSYLTRNYLRDKYNQDTALAIFKFMVINGADIGVNPIGYGGTTLLWYVCSNYPKRAESHYKELVLFMLRNARMLKESQWESVLGTLSRVPSDVAEEMLKLAPDGTLEGAVNLMFSSSYRKASPEIVKLLAQKNVDFNNIQRTYFYDPVSRKRQRGSFPVLYIAVRSGQPAAVIKELLKYGADKNWQDSDGKKAIDYAHTEEVKRLLK